MIRYVSGDLFESGCDAIVNTVNCVGVMGKGLALQFKQRYPANFFAYRKACSGPNRLCPGGMFITHNAGGPWIINFATKNHWRDPSQLSWIEDGIPKLRQWLDSHPEVHSIAIPKLGCSLGQLSWEQVRPILERNLADCQVKILIYGEPPRAV